MSPNSLRRLTVVAVTGFCVLFLVSPSVRAEYPFSADSFPVGWYDSMRASGDPTAIAGYGGNLTIAYWGSSNAANRQQYLDNAFASGVNVIMGINEAFINGSNPVNVSGILDIINTYDDHPAVVGWYTADEPYWNGGISLAKLQLAYDTIKSVSSKPVSICFGEPTVERGIAYDWRSAYDQFQIDSYPCRMGEPEFSRLETKWKPDMQTALSESLRADRPWWSVMAGWADEGSETSGYRLPTFNEARFMNYYSLTKDPIGLIHFAYYRTGHSTPAHPGEVYPYDGRDWLRDVWSPLAGEINTLGVGLQAGKVTGVASDDRSDILTDVYYDPDTGKYYLVSLNDTTGLKTSTFTVNLVLPGEKFISATPLFEGDQPAIPIIGTQFADEFSQYEVHVYELETMLLGDANGDGLVSADDYAAVQACFGDSGAPGLLGDSNGSGAVSTDDYSSVRTNFGRMGSMPVPEPATMAMLGAGLVVLRRRKT